MSDRPWPIFEETLRSALSTRESITIVCYTSFGIVRGLLTRRASDGAGSDDWALIALNDAVVEHYSNHIPTEKYPQLFIKSADIRGFALFEVEE